MIPLIFLFLIQIESLPKSECEKVEFKGTKPEIYHPALLVGGLGANALECKLDKSREPHPWCFKDSKWYQIYINIYDIIPFLSEPCFLNNMKLQYNETEQQLQPFSPGVEIRSIRGLEGVEYLSEEYPGKKLSCYMHPLIDYFEQAGYERNMNLDAYTYDFRLSPTEWMDDSYTGFQERIEKMYTDTGNSSVTIISHSLGCTFTQNFLTTQSPSWKKKYVRRFVSLGGPWNGCVENIPQLVSGDFFGFPVSLKSVLRDYGGVQWLIPQQARYDDSIILYTKDTNYTLSDYEQLLIDAFGEDSAKLTFELFTNLQEKYDKLEHPGVDVICTFGDQVDTPFAFHMENLEDKKFDVLEYVNGDGIVDENSLGLCEIWKKEVTDFETKVVPVEGVNHVGFVETQKGVEIVFDLVYS